MNRKVPDGLKLRYRLQGHRGVITRMAWSPDGKFLASPSRDGTIQIWDALNGTNVKAIEGFSGRNTVWLNGRPHDMGHPRDGILVNVGPDATTARVRIGDDAPADLRVGESINRGTGERRSGLGNGQVSAQRAGRP